jgi:hypothetical protein
MRGRTLAGYQQPFNWRALLALALIIFVFGVLSLAIVLF